MLCTQKIPVRQPFHNIILHPDHLSVAISRHKSAAVQSRENLAALLPVFRNGDNHFRHWLLRTALSKI